MDGISVRAASPEDAAFLLGLARDAYADVLSRQFDGWKESVHGRRFTEKIATQPFYVAESNGAPVAAVSYSVHPDHVRVNELVVLPTFQQRGIGSFLLEREIERARSLGLPIRLHTFRLNRALRLYERHGFVITERDEHYIHLERTFAADSVHEK